MKTNSAFYGKTGVDEVPGMAEALKAALKPVRDALKGKVHWNDCEIRPTEYKSRDGFIPYSSNYGGAEIHLVIPKCEEYDFGFLDFGECDECGKETDDKGNLLQCGYEGQECGYQSDGYLDASLRIWLKYEGMEGGRHRFYLYAGGGNNDAPYFRTAKESTIFEAGFSSKSVAGIGRAASKHVAGLVALINGKKAA